VERDVIGNDPLRDYLICKPEDLKNHDKVKRLLERMKVDQLRVLNKKKADLDKAFRFFLEYLSAKRYRYVSEGGVSKHAPHGPVPDQRRYDELIQAATEGLNNLNLFFHPTAPTGNCLDTASALLLLFIFLGWTSREVKLAQLVPNEGGHNDHIVYTHEAVTEGHSVTFKKESSSTYVSTVLGIKDSTKGSVAMAAVDPDEIDTPFQTHWVVWAKGILYDGNYGCKYADPNAIFEQWPWRGEMRIFGEAARGSNLFISPKGERCLVQLPEALNLSHGRPITRSIDNYLLTPQAASDTVTIQTTTGDISLPRKTGRLFGWCVPEADASMKTLLMQAVRAYEASTSFWRQPSESSKASLCKIRKFCGQDRIEAGTVADRLYRNINWAKETPWSDGESRERVYALLGLNLTTKAVTRPLVGKRLWEELCDAFEVPDWLRSKIPRPE